jgi:hypothetical protein
MQVFQLAVEGHPLSLVKIVWKLEKYVKWGVACMEWKIVVLCGKSVVANYIVGKL